MAEERARIVRILRSPPPSPAGPPRGPVREATDGSSRPQTPRPAAPRRYENAAAVVRSKRLYLLGFVLLPMLLWATIVALVLGSPYAAVRSDEAGVVYLTAILVVFVGGGYWLTLGRTPRRFRFDEASRKLEVTYFENVREVLVLGAEAFQAAREVHTPDLFSPQETELLEFHNPPYRSRRWIVERRLLDPVVPRHPSAGRRSMVRKAGSLDRE